MKKIIFLFFTITLISCGKKNKLEIDTSGVTVNFILDRFDKDFYQSKKSITQLKHSYPFLFPSFVNDSIWMNKRSDADEKELFEETMRVFTNLDKLKLELTALFKHIKYYNPNFKSPRVITMITNIDYDSRVVYKDSLLNENWYMRIVLKSIISIKSINKSYKS